MEYISAEGREALKSLLSSSCTIASAQEDVSRALASVLHQVKQANAAVLRPGPALACWWGWTAALGMDAPMVGCMGRKLDCSSGNGSRNCGDCGDCGDCGEVD